MNLGLEENFFRMLNFWDSKSEKNELKSSKSESESKEIVRIK